MRTKTSHKKPAHRVVDIKYVQSMPGVGKTQAAINFMYQHLLSLGTDRDPGTRILYVAPTITLLLQTYKGLMDKIYGAGHSHLESCTACIYSGRIGAHAQDINSRIMAAFNDSSKRVIFITHHSFLELRSHPEFPKTTVIFDEDRQWVAAVSKVNFSSHDKRLFDKMFRTVFLSSDIRKVFPNPMTSREARTEIARVNDARTFDRLWKFHCRISPGPDGSPPRVSGYGALSKHVDGTYQVVQVEIPFRPFEGFRDAFVLSANFDRSQMFFLLLRDQSQGARIRLIDYTETFLAKYLPEAAIRRVQAQARYKRVVLIPLLNNDADMLSITSLSRGFIGEKFPDVPREWFKAQLARLRELEAIQSPNVHEHVLRKKHGIHSNIVEWLCEASVSARNMWMQNLIRRKPSVRGNADAFRAERPLVFTNYGEEEKAYRRWSGSSDTVYLEHAQARGMNEWISANTIFYLAAVNADPKVRQVLETLTKGLVNQRTGCGYDSNFDYSVANALQCLGRGNVRNHRSRSTMLVMVPTLRMAEYLKEAMYDLPTIDTSFMKSHSFSLFSTTRFGGNRKPGSSSLTTKDRKRLDAIKTAISRARKVDDKERIQKLEEERRLIWGRAAQAESAKYGPPDVQVP